MQMSPDVLFPSSVFQFLLRYLVFSDQMRVSSIFFGYPGMFSQSDMPAQLNIGKAWNYKHPLYHNTNLPASPILHFPHFQRRHIHTAAACDELSWSTSSAKT